MKKKYNTLTGAERFVDGFPFQYNTADHTSAYQGWHDHDFNEIVLITEGKGYHKTLQGKHRIRKGSVLFIRINEPHSYKPDEKITVFNLMFGNRLLAEADQQWDNDGELEQLFADHREKPIQLKPEEYIVCESVMKRMAREIEDQKTAYKGMIASLFSEFVVNLIRSDQNTKAAVRARETEADQIIRTIITYISNRYPEKITLEAIAKQGAYSPSYMSSFFKKQTGYTLSEYINEIRIQKACEYLTRTDRTVLDVSLEVGFNSLSLFNRTFKKLIGTTPREYRGTSQ